MINRRGLLTGTGKIAVASSVFSLALGGPSQAAQTDGIATPAGPWERFGTVRRAGGTLYYAEIGPEDSPLPPILLTHKVGGWMADWRFVAEELGKTRRVIALDLPGHGNSTWDGPAPHVQTPQETAALIQGFLFDLEIPQVEWIGTSLGGVIGVYFAAFYPDRIASLALVSCALGGARSREFVRDNLDSPDNPMFDAAGLPTPIPAERLVSTFGAVNPDQMAAEGNASRAKAGLWIRPHERGVVLSDIASMLPKVPVPTLIMLGDNDPLYVRHRQNAEASLPISQTRFVPDSGAFVMQDNPAATSQMLREWLDSLQ